MGTIFTLEADTLAIIQAALDDLITELGKECLLVYPPKWVDCPVCAAAHNPGSQSTSRWRTGSPLPFQSVCPSCNGQGKHAQEQSETVTMSCQWDPQEFRKLFPQVDVRVPFSTLQTKCYLTDAPKLLRCDHMRLQVPIEGLSLRKYKLASDPSDKSNIVQGRYAIAYWTQMA